MNNFSKKKKVGLVSRIPTKSKQNIKKELGIKSSERIVLVALGGSKKKIKYDVNVETKILSMGSNVRNGKNVKNVTNWIEGQDLVQISDLVICKCGYGMISECLSNGVPFFYLADNKHNEQAAISKELHKNHLGKKVSFHEINSLKLNDEFFSQLTRIQKKPLDNQKVARLILEFI